jgi:hypothetical protein
MTKLFSLIIILSFIFIVVIVIVIVIVIVLIVIIIIIIYRTSSTHIRFRMGHAIVFIGRINCMV